MEVVNIKNNDNYLKEYIQLCSIEWGNNKLNDINNKLKKIQTNDKVISVLALIENGIMIGFISLFKYDGDEYTELTPWCATNYVKKEYRGCGYSKVLIVAIIKEAIKLGYNRLYLKTDLLNYYEKFGAKYLKKLNNGEKLYYIDLKKD